MSRKAFIRSSGWRRARSAPSCAQHPGSDRMAFGMVAIKKAFRRCPVGDLGQLPAQIHRVLNTDAEALSTHRVMHMCGVARQQDSPVAIGRGLPGHR